MNDDIPDVVRTLCEATLQQAAVATRDGDSIRAGELFDAVEAVRPDMYRQWMQEHGKKPVWEL